MFSSRRLARTGRRPYLSAMALPRPAGPRALWADLRAFARERSKVQLIAATLAVLMPAIIIYGFYKDAKTNILPGEQIVYAESWTANRSDAEIQAAQAERQKQREAIQAERQRQFKELGARFGVE
jgi:hypothetical protein